MFGILVTADMISRIVWFILLSNGNKTILKKPNLAMYIVGIGMMFLAIGISAGISAVQGTNEFSSSLAVISVTINIAIIAIALADN